MFFWNNWPTNFPESDIFSILRISSNNRVDEFPSRWLCKKGIISFLLSLYVSWFAIIKDKFFNSCACVFTIAPGISKVGSSTINPLSSLYFSISGHEKIIGLFNNKFIVSS